MRRGTSGLLALTLTTLVLSGCGAAAPGGAEVQARPTAARTTSSSTVVGNGTHVLAISIDGLNPDALRRLGRAQAPNFWYLIDHGASTLNARTDYEQTVTLPNHTSMMTGRRIDARHGGHGVTWDDDRPKATVQSGAHHRVASVFNVVHDAGGSTALFSTKTKFGLYDRSWPAAIDRFTIKDSNDPALAVAVRKDLVRNDRTFTFLHFGEVDVTGHAHGFMSPAYVAAAHRVDGLLGQVLSAIRSHASVSRHLVVILTADHGGIGRNHTDRTVLGDYRIPFLVWGPGIASADLYSLNPGYVDPGTSRPRYGGKQPVRNGNVADLATSLIGLGPVDGSQFGRRRPLRVAPPTG